MINRIAERILQPLSRRGIPDVHLEYRRQAGEDDPAELRVARQIAANQLCHFTAACESRQDASFCEDLSELFGRVHRCDGRAVTQAVHISLREDDDVAGGQAHSPIFLFEAEISPSFEQQMEHDDVTG